MRLFARRSGRAGFDRHHTWLANTIQIVWNEIKYRSTLIREFGDLPPIHCFPNQLNQVFMNLLINASHAIENQWEITVKSWCKREVLFVAISDNGCGIAAEAQSGIFEPFFTSKPVGEGTGLGLSISYDIVKKHGGGI